MLVDVMINKIKGFLKRKIESSAPKDVDGLDYWRHKIYYSLSLALVVFGFVAYIPSVVLSVYNDYWSVAVLDTVVYSVLLIIFFLNSIPFAIRVNILLFIIYLLGMALLLLLGPVGAGLIWLFSFPVLSSILKGFRSAFIATFVNFLSLVLLGYLIYIGVLSETMMAKYDFGSWCIISVNFICLNLLVSVPIAVLLNGLALTIEEEKNAKINLSKRNNDLKRKNNDLDNFIYTASHDLKSPISNIEGLIHILEMELSDNEKSEVKRMIALIKKSTDRFQNTINSLTEVSKAQQDEIEESFENINIEEILEDIKFDISLLMDKYHPVIHTDFKIKEIRFSKKDITSILSNLLSNAIKYSSPQRPSEVWIQTDKKDHDFILIVKDNGLGMQADYKEKLFKMFKRLHDHVEGTGIGLYIIKRIVENYGGTIEVDSTKGVGSEFKVTLKLQ